MSFNPRRGAPVRRSGRPNRGGGFPAWLVFLSAVALVFAAYYILRGAQDYLRTGGLGVAEATERAVVLSSATAVRVTRMATELFTPRASATPIPECQDFRVIVPEAIVREAASLSAPVVTGLPQGSVVCVLGREGETEFYVIDSSPETRRLELAYMHETVIEPVNPTATPAPTVTPAPTQTPSVTPTPTQTLRPAPSDTPSERRTPIPTSVPPTPTGSLPLQSA